MKLFKKKSKKAKEEQGILDEKALEDAAEKAEEESPSDEIIDAPAAENNEDNTDTSVEGSIKDDASENPADSPKDSTEDLPEDDEKGKKKGKKKVKEKSKDGKKKLDLSKLSKRQKILLIAVLVLIVIVAVLATVLIVKTANAKKHAASVTTTKVEVATEKVTTTAAPTEATSKLSELPGTKATTKPEGPTKPQITDEYTTTASVPIGPDFLGSYKGTDLAGKAVDAKIFAGKKLTMINIWATNDYYSLHELPDLAKVSKDYASKGVQLVGAITDYNNTNEISSELSKNGITYLQLRCDTFIRDAAAITNGGNTIPGTPFTFFVDANGEQVGMGYSGARSETQWKGIIDELLKQVK